MMADNKGHGTVSRAGRGGLLLATAAMLAGGAGCASLNKPYPPQRYYVFEAPGEATPAGDAAEAERVLRVRPFEVAEPYNGDEFVYRAGSRQASGDFYHRFLAPPGTLLTEQTRRWLQSAGLYQAVVSPTSGAKADYVLEGLVTELYGRFPPDGPGEAVLAVQFSLLRADPRDPAIVWHAELREVEPVADRTPAALVGAWNRALRRVLEALVAELSRVD